MKLPKVPDFLKIPEKTELTYTSRELDALKIQPLYNGEYLGEGWMFWNRKKNPGVVRSMLETPLDEKSLIYRHEFFSELTNNKEKYKDFFSMIYSLPEKQFFKRDGCYEYLEGGQSARFICLPETFERILSLDFTSTLYKDLKSTIEKFNLGATDFFEARKYLKKNGLSIKEEVLNKKYMIGNYSNNSYIWEDCEGALIEELRPFRSITSFAKKIRDQLSTYLIFGELLGEGNSPKILSGKKNIGSLVNSVHHEFVPLNYTKDNVDGVPNDASWDNDSRLTLITGSNSGGKSVYLRTIGLNTLLAINGFNVLADKMELSPVRRIWPAFDFGDEKGAGHLETGLKYLRNMAENATKDDLLLMDEPAQGAEPAAEYELAKGNISKIAYLGGFNSFIVTHDIDMMKEFEGKDGVVFKRVADYDDTENKYKIMDGLATGGYGMRLAKKIGADPESLEKLILERKKKGEL